MENRNTLSVKATHLLSCIQADVNDIVDKNGQTGLAGISVMLNQLAWRTLASMGFLKCMMGTGNQKYSWKYTICGGTPCYQVADNSEGIHYFIVAKERTL